jgi:hypothetical protein
MTAIALSGVERGLRRRGEGAGDSAGNLTSVQCKAIQNWHNESPLYNEYMLETKIVPPHSNPSVHC